jgi:Holliday junction DNA helicase RuvB
MTEGARIIDPGVRDEERGDEVALRPRQFDEFVGQDKIKENLRIFVEAASRRGEPVGHVLLCGPPGLGKTTLARLVAEERGSKLHETTGPAVEHKGQLAALLTRIEPNDVVFIDEIHRLSPIVEESLYTAVEDFCIDVVNGDGAYAQVIKIPLRPFTLVGATTRTGLLTNPMLSRFGYVARLDYYGVDALTQIVLRSSRLLGLPISADASVEIARRARGTPRLANRLVRLSRDFAQVLGDGTLDVARAKDALDRLEVDPAGLDEMDRRYLSILIDQYKGGPVGIETLSAALSEPRDTLEDVYEPFLLQQGFVARTARGRMATERAYEHLGKSKPMRPQGEFFE